VFRRRTTIFYEHHGIDMMDIIREGAQVGDKELILETGRMARQANGSVVIQYGDSQILCTATSGGLRPDLPFFPLVCDYVENQWAAGSIPGGYFKREGKPGEKATLTSRLIDRPCRPLFPDGYMHNTQLVAWVISVDQVNDSDVHGITGCSTALMISDIPWNGPVAGVRVGLVDGTFIANPTFAQREQSEMDIVMAVSPDAIVMVEGQAKQVPEDVMVEALEFGRESVADVLDLQLKLRDAVGKDKFDFENRDAIDEDVEEAVSEYLKRRIHHAVTVADKHKRKDAINKLKKKTVDALADDYGDREDQIKDAFSKAKKDYVRRMTVEKGKRIDGRSHDEVRPLAIEVDVVSKAHGSALFTRGETQALVTVTLGSERDARRVDTLEGEETQNFLLHYNFPAFCVGEVRPFRSTSRREIGHGILAKRALTAAMPDLEDDFPYTIRVVSDVLESNGSSSMATVCGGSLAMMDCGVPVDFATAGISMGLIKEGDDIAILTDILGDEDHMGDMDFKICGTRDGITAFQLDTKIAGITAEIMTKALEQAREGRAQILDAMDEVIDAPRKELNPNAPRIVSITIPTDKIGAVIGQGGKTIRSIQEATDTTITIEDDGTVNIAAVDETSAQQAIEIVEGLTEEPEVGENYLGTVTRVLDIGAIIEILPGTDGLCHISELTEGHVDKVEDVLQEGDECLVKVLKVERNGKIRLSRKEALSEQAG
jgi:polyribonucleotide nucleotidyltransferase